MIKRDGAPSGFRFFPCVAWGSLTGFAGQTGIIPLGGQIFYGIILNKHGIPEDNTQTPT